MWGTSTSRVLIFIHILAIAIETMCLSKVADPRYIRLRITKIPFCIIAFYFLYGRTLFVRDESSLDRVLL
jgi:hypothetical protein